MTGFRVRDFIGVTTNRLLTKLKTEGLFAFGVEKLTETMVRKVLESIMAPHERMRFKST